MSVGLKRVISAHVRGNCGKTRHAARTVPVGATTSLPLRSMLRHDKDNVSRETQLDFRSNNFHNTLQDIFRTIDNSALNGFYLLPSGTLLYEVFSKESFIPVEYVSRYKFYVRGGVITMGILLTLCQISDIKCNEIRVKSFSYNKI